MNYRGFELDPFQAEAIGHLMAGHSVLVSAPTGNGKTVVADWIVEEALREGKHVIYTAPIKALSNQKFRDYTKLHGDSNVGLVTGDLVIRPDAPCRVMTTEILRNMLLAGQVLKDLFAVVLDEIHFLDDAERGTVWEEVLIYLPKEVVIVGLSATLSNLDQFAQWLTEVRERRVEVVRAFERVVPLDFYYACRETGIRTPRDYHEMWKRKQGGTQGGGRGRGRDRGGDRRGGGKFHGRRTRDIDLFDMIAEENGLPYLYFVFSRRDTEVFARGLARAVEGSLLNADEQERIDARLDEAEKTNSGLDPELRRMYARGIAFHHAGVHVALKALVEELYEARLLKVLYCTSTFALGINMPARAVVFDGIMKFDGTKVAPLTTRGFMQKAGRAGRRGLDPVGHVVVRVELDEYQLLRPILEHYQQMEYEPVRSSFSLSWNSIVSLLDRLDEGHLREIVQKSFLSWWLRQQVAWQEEEASYMERAAEDGGHGAGKKRKEAARLRRRAAVAGDRVWDELQAKIGFLRSIGYLDAQNGFNAGAQILKNVQIEEIFVTELILAGILDELDTATLFGVLCALTNDLGRHTDRLFKLSKEDRRLAERIQQIRMSRPVTEAEEIAGNGVVWEPDLIPMGRSWAEGKSLADLMVRISARTDIAGDLITGFRRAKDLAGQLRDVWKQAPEKGEMLSKLIRSVSRDEVEVLD